MTEFCAAVAAGVAYFSAGLAVGIVYMLVWQLIFTRRIK